MKGDIRWRCAGAAGSDDRDKNDGAAKAEEQQAAPGGQEVQRGEAARDKGLARIDAYARESSRPRRTTVVVVLSLREVQE